MALPPTDAAEQGCPMNLTIAADLASKSRSRLRRMDPRTLDTSKLKASLNLPSIDLPHVDMHHVERPRIDLPHIDLPHIDLPHVELRRMDLPRLEFPPMQAVDAAGSSAAEAGRAAVGRAGEAGKAAAAFAGEAGKAAASGMGDAGRAMGGLFEAAGVRLRDLRMTIAPRPKRASVAQRGILTLAIASIVGSVVAAGAFFLHPVRGAARRAALRRRFGSGARQARTSVDTAFGAARRVTDRATELVRVPIESARDMAGSRNGQAEPAPSHAPETPGAPDAPATDEALVAPEAREATEAEAAPVLVAAGSAASSDAQAPITTDSLAADGDIWATATATSHSGTNGSHAVAARGADAEAAGE